MISVDKSTKDIIISGWEKGISNDPYEGISDIRNINLISIPKEASVNFSTLLNSNPTVSGGTVTSANAGADTITISGASGFVSQNAIIFSAVTVGGLSTNTVYWLSGSAGVYQVFTDFDLNNLVNITGTGTGTFTVFNMGQPAYFADAGTGGLWMQDINGLVWSTQFFSTWRYTGNIISNDGQGNGLIFYQTNGTNNYIFAFRQNAIDYISVTIGGGAVGTWVYGWNPTTGGSGSTAYLKKGTTGTIHAGLVAPDNKVYYCDGNYIGRFFQASPSVAFDPTAPTTYVHDQTQVLPFTDVAQCVTPLGNNLLIGGKLNVIYPWDTVSQLPFYPILVAESNIQKMVTVNTNVFALVGNRGRIYYTNGSQAVLYKKIPDHISGTVEPYYTWGGLTSAKNQLYFSFSATTNAGTPLTVYGGVWAIDVDTKALRLTNKLSYGTYAGFASAIIPNSTTNPAGTGLYIGWNSGTSTYGIDTTVSTPYSGGEATIDSDLVPIGTTLKPTTNGRVEFKLAVPLVSGESVKLQYRQRFSDNFADINSNLAFNFSGIATQVWNGFSGVYQNVNFENSQWIQIRAVLMSTASSPSYVRLTEIRLGN